MDVVEELGKSLKEDGDVEHWFLQYLIPAARRWAQDTPVADSAATLLSKVAYHLSNEGEEDLLPLKVRDGLVKLLPGGEEYVRQQQAWAAAFREAARASGMHPWEALRLLVEGVDWEEDTPEEDRQETI